MQKAQQFALAFVSQHQDTTAETPVSIIREAQLL